MIQVGILVYTNIILWVFIILVILNTLVISEFPFFCKYKKVQIKLHFIYFLYLKNAVNLRFTNEK